MVAEPPRRVWRCPDCWTPPTPPDGKPSYTVDRETIAISRLRSDSKRRKRLEGQLRVLYGCDPTRADVILRAIVYGAQSKRAARKWRAIAPTDPIEFAESKPAREVDATPRPKMRQIEMYGDGK